MDIIEEDPMYMLWAISQVMDVTPGQARYLESQLENCSVPPKYIRSVPLKAVTKKVPPQKITQKVPPMEYTNPMSDFKPSSEWDF